MFTLAWLQHIASNRHRSRYVGKTYPYPKSYGLEVLVTEIGVEFHVRHPDKPTLTKFLRLYRRQNFRFRDVEMAALHARVEWDKPELEARKKESRERLRSQLLNPRRGERDELSAEAERWLTDLTSNPKCVGATSRDPETKGLYLYKATDHKLSFMVRGLLGARPRRGSGERRERIAETIGTYDPHCFTLTDARNQARDLLWWWEHYGETPKGDASC